MKLTDKLIQKVGADKLLHFAFAGWIVSLASYISVTCMIVAIIAIVIMSIIKERYLDEKPDWMDFYAAVIGIFVTLFFYNVA